MVARFFSAFICLLLEMSSGEAFTWDLARQNQIDQLAKSYQASHGGPTIAIAVTLNGAVTHAIAIGPSGVLIPNGENIRFQIGSVTKQFTASSVLALIEDGEKVPVDGSLLTLDTRLDEYFENITQWSVGQSMTVRRLLNMTSNIPSFTSDPAALAPAPGTTSIPAQNPLNRFNMVQRFKTFPLQGPPGAFNYSNTNYFILSQIVETTKGAGQSSSVSFFHNYVRSRIFQRAGMISAGFIGEPTPAGVTDAQPIYLSPPLFNKPDWPLGAGDIVASVADIAKWNIALMSGAVLSAPLLGVLMKPVAFVSQPGNYTGCQYAMGWFVCDRPGLRMVEHDGDISGFRAYNGIAQIAGSWISVTVLANSDATSDITVLGRQIFAMLN
jgi:CubicO group peptidase (beta-lactamase class C family)